MSEPVRNPKSREIQPERKDALSIPERARDIAERLDVCDCELNDMQCGKDCPIVAALTEMAHSEREVCAKELRDYKATVHWPESNTVESCIEVLREGGQQ